MNTLKNILEIKRRHINMKITIYKNTNFGNNDMVWNVPNPLYDFSVHTQQIFDNVNMRFPLLTTRIIVAGTYDFSTSFYDYMLIEDGVIKTYYFIKTIIADRNTLLFSVILDAITTHNILSLPISGTLVRKHDTNLLEKRFDYPTALKFEGNLTNQYYDIITYDTPVTRFIESSINLSTLDYSVTLTSLDGSKITIPTLPKPTHNTQYRVTAYASNMTYDNSRAFTLYNADSVSNSVLNTVRGLSGDGGISDSYAIPTEAITVSATGAEVTLLTGKFVTKVSQMKLEIDFTDVGYIPKNEAIKGMFTVTIMSLQEKTKITFPAWELQNSVDINGFFKLNLWCDPKPSGAPYCCPDQVETLFPFSTSDIISLATIEVKSVRGGQWLRNPLIYSTGRGEIFSTIETQLQRERSEYEKKVALNQLEISKRERDIQIGQQDYAYQSGLASSLIGGGMSLLSKDFSGAFSAGKVALDGSVNHAFVGQMRDLQHYEQETQKTLINMANSNNLKNLNVAESIRRVVPREVVFQPNESLGSYEQYNGFAVTLSIADKNSLIAKDMEFSKFGYPVYEAVTNFQMLDHLRTNHTVFQFESPLLDIGGVNGDMIREILQSGIRILSKPYSQYNILNNPKLP
jgi:hypothetical protein